MINALQNLFDELPADATRLFHGRGHCYEGLAFLNIDWFEPVVWVVMYGDVEDTRRDAICRQLLQQAERQSRIACISVQRRVRGSASQEIVYGSMPERCEAREDGARYELSFGLNQNIGFFLDARPGRQWLRRRAAGKRVLNLFSYTCSFSIAALLGDARTVVNIDMAKSTLATGQRNHALNGIDVGKARFLPHDIFRSTRKLESLGPYDLVVIDPPSRQKRSFEADRDYARLLGKLEAMLAPGAQILACLNAPYLDERFLPATFAERLPRCEYVERLPQREDFPEADINRCPKMQVFHCRS